MKRNNPKNSRESGYPAQGEYNPGGYPGGMPYPGYPGQTGYQAPQGYPQQPDYSQPQGYPQGGVQPQGYPQGYPQQGYAQPQGYQTARNYQTPQVTGSQQPAGTPETPAPMSYTGQGTAAQGVYAQQGGYGQAQAGYPGTAYAQPGGYQQAGAPGDASAYPYTGSQQPAGSYIPQTPYSQGYASPGYQTQTGYAQGYSAYQQMGRGPQMPVNPQQDMGGQMPLNGGGYVPPPVRVKRQPFVMTDALLLVLSAVLLALFALGLKIDPVKWAFLALAGGSIALFWIRPMIESNKRLCYTIVFGLLMIVTIVAFATKDFKTNDPQQTGGGSQTTVSTAGQTSQKTNGGAAAVSVTPTQAANTSTPEPDTDSEMTERLRMFFSYWAANRQDDMLMLCLPSWVAQQENPKAALYGLMATRTPKEFDVEGISGTPNDTSRTVTVNSLMDRSNGKEAVRYRLSVVMDKYTDGQWYVNPKSLQTYENADTPDPSITATPAATATPYVDSSTILYYNLDGGKYYHLDPNCKTTNAKYLPFKGHFTYAEINNDKYKDLKPCAICGAPSR